jgi:hypothetical protein
MYCRACLDIFRAYHRQFVEIEQKTEHQSCAEAVHQSYGLGWDICKRLWYQLMNSQDGPDEGTDRFSQIYNCLYGQLDQGSSQNDPWTR